MSNNTYKRANFYPRFFAFLIDIILVYFLFFIQKYSLINLTGVNIFIPDVFIFLTYNTLLVSSKWQATIGKMFFKLIVENEKGERLIISEALTRTFLYLLSALPLFYGFFMMSYRKDKKTLHDLLTKTSVMKK